MKITIEPTDNGILLSRVAQNHKVEITHPSDDLNFEEAMDLTKRALIAWGFSPDSVKEYFREEE